MAWYLVKHRDNFIIYLYLQRFYVHARPVSLDTLQQIMPTLYTYGSLHTWMIVRLTAAKFKSFILPTMFFVFVYVSNTYIIVMIVW